MGIFANDEVPAVVAAKAWRPPPPRGQPYSIALPGTKQEGRTAVYRHWRAADGLVTGLDPACPTVHDGFEAAGMLGSSVHTRLHCTYLDCD